MKQDPYDIAIDQILEGAEGDSRLAIRTVLIQIVQLEAKLLALSEQTPPIGSNESIKNSLN